MLRNILSGGDPIEFIISLLLTLPIALLSLSMHEMAHGYVASKLGDPTAKSLGRITLNPIKHLDPIGFISTVIFGIGWANPVPINTRYFKKPRRDMALSAAAGPISNLLLALIFAIILKVFLISFPNTLYFVMTNHNCFENIMFNFLFTGISLNIALAVFNLIPVPPFDGSRIAYVFLPPKYYFGVMKYERYIAIGFILLLLLGIFDPILNFVRNSLMSLLFVALRI
jgi:Zn-dependent protease